MGNSKFFTNEPDRDLYTRFDKILRSNVQFFDVLVGYFRTSGFYKMSDALKNVEKIRILVGLNVDAYTVKIIDYANEEIEYERKTTKEGQDIFSDAVENEFIKTPDTLEVEEGIRCFIDWLKSGKLELRMYTEAPMHAKVYVMRKNQENSDTHGSVITGSSNFSKAGLINNLEFNVELRDDDDVDFALEKFEDLWEKGVDIKDTYVESVEEKTWLKSDITPYDIYLRTLYEFFKDEINSDKQQSGEMGADNYMNLRYQKDAVLQAKNILESYGGVFISDVVGLGKTNIAAMLMQVLPPGKKLVICPPVLVDYWQGVLNDFNVAAKVESLGKLQKIMDAGIEDFSYIFLDEAHRFRNQDTNNFTLLHQICYGKKVILISATPINNYTSDIANQIYLFQPPKNSNVCPNISDLEGYFATLQGKLDKINKKDHEALLEQQRKNSEDIRDKILKHIMIRRTRSEIVEYYKDDLENQGLKFPKLGSPQPLIYAFDAKTDMVFSDTMKSIKDFSYSRYNYDNPKANNKWDELMAKQDIEAGAQRILDQLAKECESELKEINREVDFDIKFSYKIGPDDSLRIHRLVDGRRLWNWSTSLLSGSLVIASIFTGGVSLAVGGFITGGLSLIGNTFFKDYEQKANDARRQLEWKINEHIDMIIVQLRKKMQEVLRDDLINGYMNPISNSLNEAANSLFVLSDLQYEFALRMNTKLEEINKATITEALAYIGFQGLEWHLEGLARIPGYADMIVLGDGKRFPDDATRQLYFLLKERIWFIFKKDNLKSMLGQAIGKGFDRNTISIKKINNKPRVAHIPSIALADSNTKVRLRMAQQLTGLLIVE